jgi:hypothetical protein
MLRMPAMQLNFDPLGEFPTQEIEVNFHASIDLRREFSRK